jgi:hypothetical protein
MIKVAGEKEGFGSSVQGVFVLIGAGHVLKLGNSVDLVGSPNEHFISISSTSEL